MRIVSWNCNGKFRDKYSRIMQIDADVYIIQECENPDICSCEKYKSFANNHIWIGENKNKGLGVFAKPHVRLEKKTWNSYCLRHFLPVRINNAFDLLAVWAGKPYIEEYYIYQSINFCHYSPDMIIIGDFNSNAIWDQDHSKRSHSKVVQELCQLGLESAYHITANEKQGSESQSTFYLYRHQDKGYHIDHCFANPTLIRQYWIDQNIDWLEFSDHLPIVLEI